MYPKNVIIADRIMEGERLELGDKNLRYYLGPNLVMQRCTLVLRVPSDLLHPAGARFIDCTIEVKRQLKEVMWYEAELKGCRFTGRLFSCDFGHKPSFDQFHEKTVAATFSATALAKEAGVTEDRIRALLEGHSDIIY